jgi:hypothetical protein
LRPQAVSFLKSEADSESRSVAAAWGCALTSQSYRKAEILTPACGLYVADNAVQPGTTFSLQFAPELSTDVGMLLPLTLVHCEGVSHLHGPARRTRMAAGGAERSGTFSEVGVGAEAVRNFLSANVATCYSSPRQPNQGAMRVAGRKPCARHHPL